MLNHFVTMSRMAATAAILKILNCYLTWSFALGQLMLWSVDHGPSVISMSVSNFSHFRHLHQNHIHGGPMAAILQVFNCYLLPNRKSDGAETWNNMGQHGDLELLKWFCSDIQDGHHGSHLENLQITSAPER